MIENIKGSMITKENRDVKFQKDTGRPCPVCGKGNDPSTLHVRTIIEDTAELECPACSYSEPVPTNTIK